MIDRRRSVAVVESDDGRDGRMNAMLNKSARKTEELLQAIRRTSFIRDASEPVSHTPKHYTSLRTNPTTANLNKRQSMDFEVLLALKKDTDAILERRASLLSKVRPTHRPTHDDDPHQMRRGSTHGGEQSTSHEHRHHHPPRMRSTRSKLSSDDDTTVVKDQMTSTLSSNTTTTSSSDTSSSSSLRRVRTVSMPERQHRFSSTKSSELPFEEPVVNLRSRASRNMMIRNRESRLSPSSSSITLSRASDSLPETPPESVVEETKPYHSSIASSNHSNTSTNTRSSSSSYRSSRRVTVCDPAIPDQIQQQQSLPRTRHRSSTVLDDRSTPLRSRRNTVSARPMEHHHQVNDIIHVAWHMLIMIWDMIDTRNNRRRTISS